MPVLRIFYLSFESLLNFVCWVIRLCQVGFIFGSSDGIETNLILLWFSLEDLLPVLSMNAVTDTPVFVNVSLPKLILAVLFSDVNSSSPFLKDSDSPSGLAALWLQQTRSP